MFPCHCLSGGIGATLLAAILYMLQMKNNETASYSLMVSAFISGSKAMMPAVLILIFAWALTDLIGKLETGAYLSDVVLKCESTGCLSYQSLCLFSLVLWHFRLELHGDHSVFLCRLQEQS